MVVVIMVVVFVVVDGVWEYCFSILLWLNFGDGEGGG